MRMLFRKFVSRVSLMTTITSFFLRKMIADYTAAGGILQPGAQYRVIGENAFFVNPIDFAQAFDGFTSGAGVMYDANNRKVTGTNLRTIREEAEYAFAEFKLDGEVGNMPMQLVVGLRYESTDVKSSSLQSIPIAKDWASDNDFTTRFAGEGLVTQLHDYDNLLPNIDFSLDVTDNMKVRASMSKTIVSAKCFGLAVLKGINNPISFQAFNQVR